MSRPVVHPLWRSLAIERDGAHSLQVQVSSYFRTEIVERRLCRSRRLPSWRQPATDHGVSRTTPVETHERLIAEGYLMSWPDAGLFRSYQPPRAW